MSDLGYYEQSYPPSLWATQPPPATNVFPSAVTPGAPGAFSNPLSPPATLDIPDDLTELNTLGALGQTDAWVVDDYVDLEDASKASWDGTAWVAGVGTAVPPAPPDGGDEPGDGDDGDVIIVPDPGALTVDEAKSWVMNLGDEDDPAVTAATQEMLNLERAGQNRATLVEWLDKRNGVT